MNQIQVQKPKQSKFQFDKQSREKKILALLLAIPPIRFNMLSRLHLLFTPYSQACKKKSLCFERRTEWRKWIFQCLCYQIKIGCFIGTAVFSRWSPFRAVPLQSVFAAPVFVCCASNEATLHTFLCPFSLCAQAQIGSYIVATSMVSKLVYTTRWGWCNGTAKLSHIRSSLHFFCITKQIESHKWLDSKREVCIYVSHIFVGMRLAEVR